MSESNLSPVKDLLTVTIAQNAALSGDIYGTGTEGNEARRRGFRGLAIEVPALWTAADIGFEVSRDASNYFKLCDEFNQRIKITGITTNEARVYIAPAALWAAGFYPYVRLASLNTSTGASENQLSADRTLRVILLR